MNNLKPLRLRSGISQAKLGEMLNCTDVTISRYETGQRDIDSSTICRLCDIFGCTADYLLGRSELPSAELTPAEISLLLAYRRADGRARDMVDLALEPFREKDGAAKAI